MNDFIFNAPTKILFGKDQLKNLGNEIKPYANRILLVYGKGSVKKNGLFDTVTANLKQNDITYFELGGVDPNPRVSTVREGAKLCKKHQVELVLAIGGGSSIDCAKAIAFAACYDGDPWDFWAGKISMTRALPVGSILTLAATGSEMNATAVITNETTREKMGKSNPVLFPKFSILDPALTFSVPPLQTAAGVADIMAHVYEFYFSPVKTAFLQDSFSEAILRTCIKYGPQAIIEPDNYEARANLMWASSMALNGVAARGKTFEGTLHGIEHAVSAITDITHGVGLAILTAPWFEYILDESTLFKFVQFAENVWGLTGADDWETARMGIAKTVEFLDGLGLPLSFAKVGVVSGQFEDILDRAMVKGSLGVLRKLSRDDVREILMRAR